MRIFWTRFTIFSILWVLLIIFQSEQKSLSILCFAVTVGFFFLSSIKKGRFVFYVMISILIFLHGFVLASESFITVLLLLYVTTEAAFRLREKQLLLYGILNLILSIWMTYMKSDPFLEMTLVSLFLYFLVLIINRMTNERNEQKEIHDQLLGEYRRLRRMNNVAEREARLEERTKIARDIHDSVGHRLTALMMKLEMLAIQNKNTDYDELKKMARKSLEETRQAVKALQIEETEGLATVVHLIRKLESESHMLVQFTMRQGILTVPLTNDKSVILYRVIQESLTNAMRHAQSREVHITLGKSATGDISFEITNAIFYSKAFTFGFGLTNMKSRLEEMKGTLNVYQTEKHFVVNGTIPID